MDLSQLDVTCNLMRSDANRWAEGTKKLQQDGWNFADVSDALEQILLHPDFVDSPRQQAFLRFVVEETLAGRASQLKAFTIATSVFGRSKSFDAQNDSIVRVEAMRLRRLLDRYNDAPGMAGRLQIRLRRGSYVPEFAFPPTPPTPSNSIDEETPTPREAQLSQPQDAPKNPRWWIVAAVVGVTAIAVAGTLNFFQGAAFDSLSIGRASPAVPIPRYATIRVDPLSSSPVFAQLAGRVTRELEDTLSLFDNPTVFTSESIPSQVDYQISGVTDRVGDDMVSFSFRITRRTKEVHEIIWTRRFDNIPIRSLMEGNLRPLIAPITSVAQTYGAIHSDMHNRIRSSTGITTAYDCVVLTDEAFDAPSVEHFAEAEDCLKRILVADPDFGSGSAALSNLEVARWLDAIPPVSEDRLAAALQLARDATKTAPSKGRTQAANFWALFFSGQYDMAFDSAHLALQFNPYSSDTLARVGAAEILRGRIDEGLALLDKAAILNSAAPSWPGFFRFLVAHLKGDRERAQQYASGPGAGLFPLGLVAQIIVANERGDAEAARRWHKRLFHDFPGFASDIGRSFDRWAIVPEIRDRLLADLAIEKAPKPMAQ